MKPLIVGFGHRKRVGKDTAADALHEAAWCKFGVHNVRKVSFAWALKAQCFSLFSWDGHKAPSWYDRHPEDREKLLPTIGKTPRQIWIEVGNAMRRVYPDVWIDLVLRNQPAGLTIISDVRYANEIKAIRQRGGIVVKVERESANVSNDEADAALADFNGWDYRLANNGTVEDLQHGVRELLEKIAEAV